MSSWPTRSIAQGDSSSPKSLCAVLSLWSTEGSKFLFMDDRSIVAADEATLSRDMASTDAFDWETGALENASKRQVWRRGENKEIEHIGILAVPDRPDLEIKPAASWAKCLKCLKKIRACPGGLLTRTVLTKSYAKPLWSWCAPVFSLPPSQWCKKPLRCSSSRTRNGGARAVSGARTLSCTPDFQVSWSLSSASRPFCGTISKGSLKSSILRWKNTMLKRASSSAGKSPSVTKKSLKHSEEGGEYGVTRQTRCT